jgi:wobble nucleotide-excising tRNase
MAAISTAKHLLLINKIKAIFQSIAEENARDILQNDAEQLQHIFEKYNGSLLELNKMIKEYDLKQRKAKVLLRKHQLLIAKQGNHKS